MLPSPAFMDGLNGCGVDAKNHADLFAGETSLQPTDLFDVVRRQLRSDVPPIISDEVLVPSSDVIGPGLLLVMLILDGQHPSQMPGIAAAIVPIPAKMRCLMSFTWGKTVRQFADDAGSHAASTSEVQLSVAFWRCPVRPNETLVLSADQSICEKGKGSPIWSAVFG